MDRRKFLINTLASTSLLGLSAAESRAAESNDSKNLGLLGASSAEFLVPKPLKPGAKAAPGNVTVSRGNGKPAIEYCRPSSSPQVQNFLDTTKDEFVIVQASKDQSGSHFADPFDTEPLIKGDDNQPDVALRMELQGFHLAGNVELKEKTRAIMRVTATNGTSLNPAGDILHWAVTTGIDLYRQSRKAETLKSKTPDDLSTALSKRPIEIRQGLGSFQIEIIKHKEPPWWKEVFSFLASNSDVVVQSFGFPAITKTALTFLDDLLTKVADLDGQPLLTSNFAPYAFSERGRSKYEQGIGRVGRLNKGTWVLVKAGDFQVLQKLNPYFYGSFGRLIPTGKTPIQFQSEISGEPKKDPFNDMTYAVFNADLTPFKFEVS